MRSKERVITALNHEEPDRVPVAASFVPEFALILRDRLGLPSNTLNPHGGAVHDLEEALDLDLIQYSVGIANSYYASSEEHYTCEWGITWRQVAYQTPFGTGRYTEIARHPLADVETLVHYIPPDPNRDDLYLPLEGILNSPLKERYVFGVVVCTVFEGAWYLRGLDRLLTDMVVDEETAEKILDIPFLYHLDAARRLIKMGVDGIWLGDDVGTQRGMLLSPQMWRRYLKPRMEKICHELKELNPQIKIAYHSDGNILPIIDDLIEIGIDVLNPVQPSAMNPEYLKNRYGDRISFWGAIDEQHTLPFGTVEDVVAETRQRIQVLGRGGGFIVSPTHHVQLDTPMENFLAFLKTAQQEGRYPLNS